MRTLSLFITGLLFLMLLPACQPSSEPVANENPGKFAQEVTLQPAEWLEIPIDTLTTLHGSYLAHYFDPQKQKHYLAYLNDTQNEIQFYDLQTKALDWRLAFDEKAAVGKIDGFYVLSPDSVLVAGVENYQYFLCNRKGEKIKTYRATPANDLYWITDIRNFTRLGLFQKRKFIYHRLAYVSPRSEKYWDYPIAFRADLQTQKVDTVFKYEGARKRDIFTGAYHTFACDQVQENGYVYSLFMDNYVYYTDFKNPTQAHYAGSRYFEHIPSMASLPDDSEKEFTFFRKNYSYRHIIYDAFRKVYYRFVLHPTRPDAPDYRHDKPFSIIILNEKLKKIGETEIFKDRMFYDNFFVGPEGLYISQDHFDNPRTREDSMRFRLFKLKQNS
ncbi:MAG: DUF4221 family protein [Microscillaceae bacterium]|nr:DUF4221 family protein [Microscillaceae bacterium]